MEEIEIEKLVFGGQALGHFGGKPIFVWGALPGEKVAVEVIQKRKGVLFGVTKTVIKPSPDRIPEKESHYLSCSPWQIIKPEAEIRWKREIAQEVYKDIDYNLGQYEIVDQGVTYGYRNKMEYSFEADDRGEAFLAFFNRGSRRKFIIDDCELAKKEINIAAKKILAWVNKNKIENRSLKSLILRANSAGQVIAGLFLKDRLEFSSLPTLDANLIGFRLIYSTHKSPASVITDVLGSSGQLWLEEDLLGRRLRYGLMSFFQINAPLFLRALGDLGSELDLNGGIVDFYSGVGAISLSLNDKFRNAILVESNEEAVGFAEENIRNNKIENCEAVLAVSEKTIDLISPDKVMVFDPPRSGLHQKIVDRVLEVKPVKIIYLSCDLATQARDLRLLQQAYKVKLLKGYNFFPRTPHIEGLCVLERT